VISVESGDSLFELGVRRDENRGSLRRGPSSRTEVARLLLDQAGLVVQITKTELSVRKEVGDDGRSIIRHRADGIALGNLIIGCRWKDTDDGGLMPETGVLRGSMAAFRSRP